MSYRASVWVEHRFPAWHNWPGAPPSRSYLGDEHRHLFHVRAELDVEHDDREVEFHDLLEEVAAGCAQLGEPHPHHGDTWPQGRRLGAMSCEMIGEVLADQLLARWAGRRGAITVSEDGECGSTIRFG